MKMNNQFRITFILSLLIIFVVICSIIGCYLTILVMDHIGLVAIQGLWILAIMVLIIAICFAILMTKLTVGKTVKPISNMIDATNQIAKGNFDVSVEPFDSVVLNATELKQLQESINSMAKELKNNEVFRIDFINNFSHEFKTPINCILGFAKQLQYQDLTNQQVKEYSEIIIKESQRLVNLSNNVLMITKLENNQVHNETTNYSLDEQLRDCILLLQQEWENKHIDLQLNLQEITINNNKDLLAQVWTNILNNAIKFSDNDSSIIVNCFMDNNQPCVDIIDHGIGMSESEVNHIFDKFYQADRSHSTSGNGLGMSVVSNILKLCHGYITIESELAKGTKVTVLL